MRGWILLLIYIGAFFSIPPSAEARDFKVYGYPTLDQGEMEGAYWLDYFVRTDAPYTFLDGKPVDKERLQRHSFELEVGVTDRWTIAGYLDFEAPRGEALEYVQMRAVVSRYRLFNPKERFFDTALYFEYYIPIERYRVEEKLETRLILEKEVRPFLIRLNPIFDKPLSGPAVSEGLEFEYAAGVYYPVTPWVRAGLEFYGNMGQIANLASPNRQTHFIFPAVALQLAKGLDLDLGLGFGLTGASDAIIFKAIVGYEFD